MSPRWKVTIVVLAAAVLGSCAKSAQAQADMIFHVAHHLGTSHSVHRGLLAFRDQLQRSGEHLQVRVYPAEQLGTERQLMEGLMLGSVDAAPISANVLQAYEPAAGTTALPFLFDDFEEAFRAEDGQLGRELFERLRARTGLVPLAYFSMGFRVLAGRSRPIATMEDFRRLRVRVPESRLLVATFQALGANPTPIPWGEVYTALALGVVDAVESPPGVLLSARMAEVAPLITLTRHVYSDMVFIVSAQFWNRCTSRQRQAIREAARAAETYQRTLALEEQTQATQLMVQAGAVVRTIDPDAMRRAVAPVYADFSADNGARWIVLARAGH